MWTHTNWDGSMRPAHALRVFVRKRLHGIRGMKTEASAAFLKKEAKNLRSRARRHGQKFFGFFFKKGRLPFLQLAVFVGLFSEKHRDLTHIGLKKPLGLSNHRDGPPVAGPPPDRQASGPATLAVIAVTIR